MALAFVRRRRKPKAVTRARKGSEASSQ